MSEGDQKPPKRARTEAKVGTGAAAVVGDAGAAQPAVAGPAAATPPPGSNLPKDPTTWTVDQVQQWFAEHNEGQWQKYATKFAGLTGENLCEMTEEQIKAEVPGLRGSAIFNDVAKLKKQASSSSTEISPGSAAGEIHWDSQRKLPDALPEPVKGGLVTIPNLDDAGVKLNNDVFYVREQVAELWDTMGTWGSGHFKVQGPPGTGKSTTLWYWCLFKAQTAPVLWIHLSREFKCVVCDVRGSTVRKAMVSSDDAVAFVKQLVLSGEHGVVVVDGVIDKPTNPIYINICGEARVWVERDADNRLLVYCASEALTTAGEDELVHGVGGVRVSAVNRVCSWSLDQHQAACAQPAFWASVKACVTGGSVYPNTPEGIQAAVNDKFILAGASARWMFGRTPDEVMKECDMWISKVADVNELVSRVTGTANHNTINHLRAIGSDRRPYIVSEYAMRALVEWNKLKSLEHLANVAKTLDNPAFDGWVLELDFLTQLKVACAGSREIEVFTDEAESINWPVSGFTAGMTIAGVSNGDDQFDFTPGQWLVPKRYNHGAFDAMQFVAADDIVGKLKARFVNVTRADRYDVKCQYMVDLLSALKERWDEDPGDDEFPVLQVEFVWIRPYVMRGDGAIAPHMIDEWLLKPSPPDGFNWDATTTDVFFKRTAGGQ
eukprot:m.155396 g.155396  ORF g.155396 m.155396 type:complete len:662 (-) comp11721_c0_seq6:102-2087(-)